MDYLCSECSVQLSKWEVELNNILPIGKLYCEFCQSKKEREIIKDLAKSVAEELDFYDYPKTIQKYKDEESNLEDFEEDLTRGGTIK